MVIQHLSQIGIQNILWTHQLQDIYGVGIFIIWANISLRRKEAMFDEKAKACLSQK